MTVSAGARKAILIGGMCSLSYLAVYIARNTLGAVSPQMIEEGLFSTEEVGLLSSIYFITYAVGQLINGIIGDRVKAKHMISFGLLLAGISSFLFSFLARSAALPYIAYGLMGFFLSMIYGPMTKVVSENTEPLYTTRCSMGYEFASLLGSPLAGLLAAFMVWRGVFSLSSSILLLMGCICFGVFTLFERRGLVSYNQYPIRKESGGAVKVLLKHHIVKFTLVALLTGVVRTTVVFWLPTYLSQYLQFSPQQAALLFTIATLVISLTTFFAIVLYERLGHDMNKTVLLCFSLSAVCFLLVFLLRQPALNILFLVLAIMGSNGAATMLWSRYCPGLRDTGMVSGATGFLDFVSYMAASASSTLFANAVSAIGWGYLILVWFGLMVVGVIIALPYDKWKRKNA